MDIRFEHFPPLWAPWALAVLSYVNFFSHHFLPDFRLALYVASGFIWARTWVLFTPDVKVRRMPLLVSALLVALFIWIAENLGTFASAWVYPSQSGGWRPVPIGKIGAWYLLATLSFVLVTLVKRPMGAGAEAASPLLPSADGAAFSSPRIGGKYRRSPALGSKHTLSEGESTRKR
jgi:uncharacterized membrane protein YoaT (DUF817 family)